MEKNTKIGTLDPVVQTAVLQAQQAEQRAAAAEAQRQRQQQQTPTAQKRIGQVDTKKPNRYKETDADWQLRAFNFKPCRGAVNPNLLTALIGFINCRGSSGHAQNPIEQHGQTLVMVKLVTLLHCLEGSGRQIPRSGRFAGLPQKLFNCSFPVASIEAVLD
eukprot:6470414-Amphidinium_carterae.1